MRCAIRAGLTQQNPNGGKAGWLWLHYIAFGFLARALWCAGATSTEFDARDR